MKLIYAPLQDLSKSLLKMCDTVNKQLYEDNAREKIRSKK
jgi:hypothetical protein